MSFILGSLTLPNPVSFQRLVIEKQSWNETLTGVTKRNIVNRKYQYVLEFGSLTQAEVGQILAQYNLQTVIDFSVDETNLTIVSTPVHVHVTDREYRKGVEYRETMKLILTEVQ